jgi:N,N'-diacetyllegionaminate synthase
VIIKDTELKFEAPLIIGEVAQAHEGSLGIAHSYIDAIADAGAGAVKFQTHIAEAESSLLEPWRVKFSTQDDTRYEYWKRMEFTLTNWKELRAHALDRGLIFMSSPFSEEAVEMLEAVGIDAWKIASGEVSNIRLLNKIAKSKKPVILSSGMSNLKEIDNAYQLLQEQEVPLSILQCTPRYPTPAHEVGLNVISEFIDRYSCPIGLSDHSGTIFPGLAAVALGAKVLEVHVTFNKKMFGPDTAASLDLDDLKLLVDGVSFIHKAQSNPTDKDQFSHEVSHYKEIFGRSIFSKTDIKKGEIFSEENLALKKPGSGMLAEKLPELLNREAGRNISKNTMISDADVL